MSLQKKYWNFLYKKLRGSINESEQGALDSWLSDSPENRREAKFVGKVWELSESYQPSYEPNVELGLKKLKKRIATEEQVIPINRNRRFLSIAASIAVLLLVGIGFQKWNSSSYTGEWLTLTAIDARPEQLQLADGTQITLNQNSSIQYTDGFLGVERKIKLLYGEAFFDVAKDPSKAFAIETSRGIIKVLGTSFNVRAYDQEEFTEVAVKSGKVAFQNKSGGEQVLLEAKQKAVLDHKTGKIEQSPTQLNELAWQNGQFNFRNLKMRTIFPILEKDFGIKITASPQILDCTYNSTFTDRNLKSIISYLEASFPWKITEVGKNNYRISGKSCK